MTSPSVPVIRTERLAKRYRRVDALIDLTMEVGRGEVFGFLGPNGAGKTTAVKLLLGLVRPTSGGGTILDAPIGDRRARARIGYLPELFRYQPWLRAREVLVLHRRLGGRDGTTDGDADIDRVLEAVGLTARAGDLVGGFSKGMQQRLGLGVALLGRPELVVLDEPTSALDPVGRADVRALIGRLRDEGTTVFLNSHLLTEVERVCDRVAIVDGGRVLATGSLDELLGRDHVRIRVTGLPPAATSAFGGFGPGRPTDDDWLAFEGVADADVPELVAAIVTAGGRVHAVDPGRATLEDRYFELVRGREA